MAKHGEPPLVLFSCEVLKINRRGEAVPRTLLVCANSIFLLDADARRSSHASDISRAPGPGLLARGESGACGGTCRGSRRTAAAPWAGTLEHGRAKDQKHDAAGDAEAREERMMLGPVGHAGKAVLLGHDLVDVVDVHAAHPSGAVAVGGPLGGGIDVARDERRLLEDLLAVAHRRPLVG